MPLDLLTPLDDVSHLQQLRSVAPSPSSPSWQSALLFAPPNHSPDLKELDATPLEVLRLGASRRFREAEASTRSPSDFPCSQVAPTEYYALDYTPPSSPTVPVALLRAPIPRRVPLKIQPDGSRYTTTCSSSSYPTLSPTSSTTPPTPRFRERQMTRTLSPIIVS